MEQGQVEQILARAETALREAGRPDLRALGFWRAVEAVKARPAWVEPFAARIAAIDQEALRREALLVVPLSVGTGLLTGGTAVGLGLIAAGYYVPPPANGLLVLAGAGALLGTTHDLTHLIVGRAVGIRFAYMFVLRPTRPQPGIKIDYASYLRTPPRARAWMHASGALVTKVLPFALIGAAVASGSPAWAAAILAALGTVQIATDVLLSTRSSDWKRFRREMRAARRAHPA